MKRRLLVDEPAVPCPQDQVEKAKNLEKGTKQTAGYSMETRKTGAAFP